MEIYWKLIDAYAEARYCKQRGVCENEHWWNVCLYNVTLMVFKV